MRPAHTTGTVPSFAIWRIWNSVILGEIVRIYEGNVAVRIDGISNIRSKYGVFLDLLVHASFELNKLGSPSLAFLESCCVHLADDFPSVGHRAIGLTVAEKDPELAAMLQAYKDLVAD